MSENIVTIRDVSMCYRITTERITSLKEYIIKFIKKEIKYKEFYALKNISFNIKKGEVFGIIGLNGAGKSTLLKVIAGILKPTKGNVIVNGSIAPLIELGAGFDMELSGRENIYLNGAILGYDRKFIDKVIDDIIEFSELEDFIDVPIKNYSSGMYARLGFSIATIVESDILIVDEILSVGDYRFQEKCYRKMKKMIDNGTTVILVSHSLDEVIEICDRVALLEHGRLIKVGDPLSVCNYFMNKKDGE